MSTNRFTTNFVVTITGVRPAAAISTKALARNHKLAFEGMACAMSTAELERWAAWSKQWPFTASQLADLDDAYTAASLDIEFVARRDAAGLTAMETR